MNTKKEIKLPILFILTGFLFLSHLNGQKALPESRHYTLVKLADGIYAAVHNDEGGYAICNAGIIDLGNKTIVIDPFISPMAARDLKQHAEYLTGRPVTLVLNLDSHNDHNGGNQVFVPGADIIGTPYTRKYIEENFDKDLEYYREAVPKALVKIQEQLREATGDEKTELIMWQSEYQALTESLPEWKMTPPDITINDTMIIYGSKRSMVVIPTGLGHTPGDMVAWLPEEKILFLSDQLFVKRHPYFGDGDPDSLKNNLIQILALNPEIAVPGHGPVGDVHSIEAMIDYIETLTSMVNEGIQYGADENRIIEFPMPVKFNDWLISGFYKKNLEFIYHQLIAKTKPKY